VRSALTKDEQAHVRAALQYLSARAGTWDAVSALLHANADALRQARAGRSVGAALAVRIARIAHVGVDDVLTGRFPGRGFCANCGHSNEAAITFNFGEGQAE
jgi:hypothetical protein